MSPQPAQEPAIEPVSDDEIDAVIEEFGGDVREIVRALLTDQAALVADAQQAVSRGFLRGLFSEGARAPRADDEP